MANKFIAGVQHTPDSSDIHPMGKWFPNKLMLIHACCVWPDRHERHIYIQEILD